MEQSQVFAKLTDIIHTLFDEYEGPVTPELNATHVEQWDSLAHVQLMVMVEKAFNISFSTKEISQLRKLDDLTSLIIRKGGASG